MHGHPKRTIGNHSNVVQCVPRHFQMFTFYNICRHAVLPLSQWPSSCSGKTFSRAILRIISQYVHEQFFSVMSQIIIIHILPAEGWDPQYARLQLGKLLCSSASASHCRSRQLERNCHNCRVRNVESKTVSLKIFIFQGHFHVLFTWWWHPWILLEWLWCILQQYQV